MAQRLSYRQYWSSPSSARTTSSFIQIEVSLLSKDAPSFPNASEGIVAELDNLGTESLLGFEQKDGSVAHFASVLSGGTWEKELSEGGEG